MWNGYKPTKAEREQIEHAFCFILEIAGQDWRVERAAKDEAKGYGNRNDGIPLIGAKALCVKWFLQGANRPNQYLRDTYFLRPAAIYLTGLGATRRDDIIAHEGALTLAVAAHDAAFKRMMDADKAMTEAAL
jgi:hypothetical protein